MFKVGVDITPGTYRSPGEPMFPTVWRRLSDFSGTGIIAYGESAGPCIVTIEATDRGFESAHGGGGYPVDVNTGLARESYPCPSLVFPAASSNSHSRQESLSLWPTGSTTN